MELQAVAKAIFKGRHLYLDWFLIARPAGGPPIQSHMIERWELSADLRTLTIQNDFETTSADGKQIILNNVRSWAEVYTRN